MPVASCKAAPCTTACVVPPCSLNAPVWARLVSVTSDEAMHTTIPGSRVPADSSNVGSPDGSCPDLDKLGGRSSTLKDKVDDIFLRLAQLLALAQSVSKFDSHVQTLTNAVDVLSTRIAGIEQTSAPSRAVSSLRKLEMGPLQASPYPQQDFGPSLDTLVVPLLPGPVTQVLWTTTGICNGNSKQTPMMKTRAAPFSCASHARKVVQAFPRGSLKEFQHRRKITKSNARAAGRRL